MVERISVQIALEGGAEIERQLADIGEAGKKAFADISAEAEKAGGFEKLDPSEVTQKLQEMGVTGTESIDKIQAAVSKATGLEKIVKGVASVETAFIRVASVAVPAIGAIAAAIAALIPSTIKTAEAINKISDQAVKFGLSFEQFKKVREELAKVGIDAQAAASGIEAYQKVLGTPQDNVFLVLDQAGNAFRFVAETSNLAAAQLPKFLEQLRAMPDTIERTNLALKNMGEAAGTQFIQGLRRAEGSMSDAEAKSYDLGQALKGLQQAWADFGGVTLAPALTIGLNALTAGIQILGNALNNITWAGFLSGAFAALNPVNSLLNAASQAAFNFGQSIAGIVWDAISGAGVEAWNAVVGAIQGAASWIGQFITAQTGIDWNTVSSAGVAAWNAVAGAIGQAKSALDAYMALNPGGGGPAGGIQTGGGAAGGGLMGGRGTGTSDSNLVWLSRGEHIMPARAVAQPGVLGFLEALRRSGGNLSAVLNGIGRFALGGMVPAAAGGGMSNVTIAFPGLPAIAGLRASSGVVDELRRAATMAQVRSGGRKPSRYT